MITLTPKQIENRTKLKTKFDIPRVFTDLDAFDSNATDKNHNPIKLNIPTDEAVLAHARTFDINFDKSELEDWLHQLGLLIRSYSYQYDSTKQKWVLKDIISDWLSQALGDDWLQILQGLPATDDEILDQLIGSYASYIMMKCCVEDPQLTVNTKKPAFTISKEALEKRQKKNKNAAGDLRIQILNTTQAKNQAKNFNNVKADPGGAFARAFNNDGKGATYSKKRPLPNAAIATWIDIFSNHLNDMDPEKWAKYYLFLVRNYLGKYSKGKWQLNSTTRKWFDEWLGENWLDKLLKLSEHKEMTEDFIFQLIVTGYARNILLSATTDNYRMKESDQNNLEEVLKRTENISIANKYLKPANVDQQPLLSTNHNRNLTTALAGLSEGTRSSVNCIDSKYENKEASLPLRTELSEEYAAISHSVTQFAIYPESFTTKTRDLIYDYHANRLTKIVGKYKLPFLSLLKEFFTNLIKREKRTLQSGEHADSNIQQPRFWGANTICRDLKRTNEVIHRHALPAH